MLILHLDEEPQKCWEALNAIIKNAIIPIKRNIIIFSKRKKKVLYQVTNISLEEVHRLMLEILADRLLMAEELISGQNPQTLILVIILLKKSMLQES